MLLCEAKLAALCRGGALSGDALARTGRCSVSVARIAALQGLPLLLVLLGAAKGCHLSNYSSVNAVAVRA